MIGRFCFNAGYGYDIGQDFEKIIFIAKIKGVGLHFLPPVWGFWDHFITNRLDY
jgi:hypothetical protein